VSSRIDPSRNLVEEVQSFTIIDLDRLSLSHGEGNRLELPVPLEPLEIGGQTYVPDQGAVSVVLEVSRPSRGYAFHLRFPIAVEGPCMRCLETARVGAEVDAREIHQSDSDDEELRSPYVEGDELDLRRWAQDAAMLAMPARILCRQDCAGLCAVCGASLNDADPAEHEHESAPDPRWAKLDELRRE
jgi:uncharacterized protein